MKTKNIITASLVGLTACSGLVLASVYTYADNNTAVDEVEIIVPVACTMTGSVDTNHTATLTPGTYSGTSTDYANGIGKTTLTTFCNDNNGFSIYAIGYTGDTDGTNTLVGATTGAIINTKAYESTDTTSNWSMKVNKVTDSSASYNPGNMTITNSFDNYHAVPDDYTKVAEYKSTTEPATTDTTLGAKVETTYAAYVATNQPADTYQGKVKYVMVHPYNAEAPISFIMQNLPANKCTTTPAKAIDNRDGTVYHIQRLADGRCWMLDNLALDLTDQSVRTSMLDQNNTKTDASYATLDKLFNGGGTASDQYPSTGVTNWTSGSSYSEPLINKEYKDQVFKKEQLSNNGDYKVGIYYNYCAASAGSFCYTSGQGVDAPDTIRDATEDICPSGWHMPTSNDNSENPGEYNVLAYAINGSYYGFSGDNLVVFESALSTPFSGRFLNGSADKQNTKGFFWSSTLRNGYTMRFLSVDDNYVAPSDTNDRNYGHSVRCILDD